MRDHAEGVDPFEGFAALPEAPAASASPAPAPVDAIPAPGAPRERLLSVGEVGEVFGRTPRSLSRWIKAGHLTPVRIGRSVFFRATDIQELITGRLSQGGPTLKNGPNSPQSPAINASAGCNKKHLVFQCSNSSHDNRPR